MKTKVAIGVNAKQVAPLSEHQKISQTENLTTIAQKKVILSPSLLSASDVEHLQRTIGNQAVGKLLKQSISHQSGSNNSHPQLVQTYSKTKGQKSNKPIAGNGLGLRGPVGDLSGTEQEGNFPEDVHKVQKLLGELGFDSSLGKDGSLKDAIMKFQQLFMSSPDGRIEPSGGTLRKLTELASEKTIIVNLDRQVLDVYANSTKVYHFDVVSGDSDNPTPPGIYKVYRKNEKYRSKKYDAQMDYAMFFHGGYAIHMAHLVGISSLLKSAGISWLGSHGCVRLSEEDARALFKWSPMNTSVVILPPQ